MLCKYVTNPQHRTKHNAMFIQKSVQTPLEMLNYSGAIWAAEVQSYAWITMG